MKHRILFGVFGLLLLALLFRAILAVHDVARALIRRRQRLSNADAEADRRIVEEATTQTEYSEKDTVLHLGLGLKRSDIRSSKFLATSKASSKVAPPVFIIRPRNFWAALWWQSQPICH